MEMAYEFGWGVVLLPAAVVLGCVLAVGVWYRRRGGTRAALVVRVVIAGLSGAMGYGLLVLAWFTTHEPAWRLSASATDWAVYALLLYFGLAIGLGTGRDGWPLAAGYLFVLGTIFATSGRGAVPYLTVCLCFMAGGFLVDELFGGE